MVAMRCEVVMPFRVEFKLTSTYSIFGTFFESGKPGTNPAPTHDTHAAGTGLSGVQNSVPQPVPQRNPCCSLHFTNENSMPQDSSDEVYRQNPHTYLQVRKILHIKWDSLLKFLLAWLKITMLSL